ncbi:MAG: bifunctional 4-hydroxy-3-methylbut-2-enyl diphosphate reductase/30S ribosomal protein S1 [Oscillospiraceae bacterium]|nr:bifunctional 4-hydroxy-3-methylbut-2-enyl diphosphate reductase/30S ribosomal protein S1 [Oscillospiraceae bacterium]
MEIRVAKSAGFCFGVSRAVKMTRDLAAEGRRVATLGPLIHNPQCVAELEAMGVVTAGSIDEIPAGYEVVIRSHGVSAAVYEELQKRGLTVHDATCPFVAKIHRIAQRAGEEGRLLLVAGDASHPEVQGIVGHTVGKVRVFADAQELSSILSEQNAQKNPIIVAQTTFQVTKWLESSEIAKKVCTNSEFNDTICSATWTRQEETEKLAKECDLMVVIGGHQSSNTQKLYRVAAKHTRAVTVETADEFLPEWLEGVRVAGITAGASTPASVIEEVYNKMSEAIREEMSFEEMLEQSLQPVSRNKVVRGVVTGITPSEITVDIGAKATGFVHISEMSDDPNAKMEELVKKGDELDLVVIKTNDQEGIVQLSKKRLEARAGQEEVSKACEEGSALEVTITGVNKGGLEAKYKGVNIFIPASQATARRGDDLNVLVKTKQIVKITECSGRRVIGSIRAILNEKSAAARELFWAEAEVGKTYTGTVKSLTNYGAFVDVGGIDGLVHISELSWNRIKHPSEVVSVGDEIEVYIRSLDAENGKVSLGFKKTEDNPWEKLKNEYPIGSVFTAPVVSLTKFGAFVRILPGVDGLVHISEISTDRVEKVQDVLNVGDEVTVKLLDVDWDKKRVSLSMKALLVEASESNDAE